MYRCKECKANFSAPAIFVDIYSVSQPPYGEYGVCPGCGCSNFKREGRKKRYAK